jgi:hypothetical protein
MKQLRNAAILVGLAAYAFFFYVTLLPSLSSPTETWRRGTLVCATALRPEEWLTGNWFGTPPQFSLDDRAVLLLAAGFILAWAAALGWLLLSLFRVTRGLTRLETAVFSMAVGLNLLSTWTLAAGLFGQLGRMRAAGLPALLTFAAAACVWYRRRRANRHGRGPTAYAPLGNVEDLLALAAAQSVAGVAVQLPPQQHAPPPPQQRSGSQQRTASPQRRDQPWSQQWAQLQRREMLVAAYRRCAGFVGRHWLWLGLPFVAAILLAAMLPPTEFDVCEYHLQAPKEFYQHGQITFLPHNVYANMALGAEMLSLLAMTIVHDWWWGALAGKTVIAAFTPLCALGLLAAGRRFYSTAAGVVAALIYISIPWLTSTSFMPNVNVTSSGLIEGASACYLFLALYALLLSRKQETAVQLPSQRNVELPPQRRRDDDSAQPANASSLPWGTLARRGDLPETHPAALVALAGYLAGVAVATKYPAVLFVLIPLAIWTLIGRSWRRETGGDHRSAGDCPNFRVNENGTVPLGPPARELPPLDPLAPTPLVLNPQPRTLNPLAAFTVFLLAAALGCGLWFAKNWALTGNPTYPLMYGAFRGATWNADKERRWERAHLPHDFEIETLGKDLGSVLLTSEWISPLVVPLALLALLGWGDKPVVVWRRLRWELLAYASLVIAAWWLFTHRIDRFWLPVLPVLALLAGAGACWNVDPWWRRTLKGLLLAGLGANFLISAAGPLNAWFVPLDQLRNDPQWITPCHYYLNNDADRGAVLAVGDAAVFDLKPTVLYNTCFDDCVFEQLVRDKTSKHVPPEKQLRPANEIRTEFASLHLAYVFVDWDEIKRYRDTYGFTDFVQPQVFEQLVKEGILELVPQKVEPLKRIYRVKQ